MTINEKLICLEELLDIEKNSLKEDMELDQLEQWDSMAVISVIAMLDDEFGKVVPPEEVKRFRTVKDILDKMD